MVDLERSYDRGTGSALLAGTHQPNVSGGYLSSLLHSCASILGAGRHYGLGALWIGSLPSAAVLVVALTIVFAPLAGSGPSFFSVFGVGGAFAMYRPMIDSAPSGADLLSILLTVDALLVGNLLLFVYAILLLIFALALFVVLCPYLDAHPRLGASTLSAPAAIYVAFRNVSVFAGFPRKVGAKAACQCILVADFIHPTTVPHVSRARNFGV